MKLNDLMADLNQLSKLLSDRYNTEVKGGLSLNPDNVSEIILTLAISTNVKALVIEAEKIVEAEAAKATTVEATTEATSETQS